MWKRYAVLVVGIVFFGVWGAVAVMRPAALDAGWLKAASRLGLLHGPLESYFRSRWRRTELRIVGVIALGVSAFLIFLLVCSLAGVCIE